MSSRISRIAVMAAVTLLTAGAALADSVTINNPAASENVPSGTVWVDATAVSSATPIWVIQIYLDGSKATEKVVNNVLSCAIDAGITVAAGNGHQLTVQTLKNDGTLIARSTITFNAVTAVSTIPDIDDSTANWHVCNGCGGGGGGNPVPPTVVGSPSEDGSALQFTTVGEGGITGGFGTSYWYATHTAPGAKIAYIKYEFDLFISTTDAGAPQAIEFECQQSFSGLTYNFGWQAEYIGSPNNRWRIFDYAGGTGWNDSGLDLTRFSGGVWHHIIAEYHVDNSTNQIHHDGLTIDGTRRFPTQNFVHNVKNTGHANELTNAIQLDMNSVNTRYTIDTDKMKITYTTY